MIQSQPPKGELAALARTAIEAAVANYWWTRYRMEAAQARYDAVNPADPWAVSWERWLEVVRTLHADAELAVVRAALLWHYGPLAVRQAHFRIYPPCALIVGGKAFLVSPESDCWEWELAHCEGKQYQVHAMTLRVTDAGSIATF